MWRKFIGEDIKMERNSNHNNRLLLRSAVAQNGGAVVSTISPTPDFVLQWGNRKRLRCMKVQPLKGQENNKNSSKGNNPPGSIPVQRTTARVHRRVVRSDFNKVPNLPNIGNVHGGNGYINLRQPPSSPSQRICRNSVSSTGMRGNNSVGGGRGLAFPATNNNQQRLQSNNNNHNEDNNNNNGSVLSDKKKRGGSSSSESDGIIPTVWPPKLAIALTNKEKEEDFLAIKGSKLPLRPKKRPKLIQRNLNLVSPGGWLCDLTLERYEVIEKKVSKKKARGLKDMGTMESDSE